jgi:hypothetical protein
MPITYLRANKALVVQVRSSNNVERAQPAKELEVSSGRHGDRRKCEQRTYLQG